MTISQKEVSKKVQKLYNEIGRAHEKIRDEGKIDSEVLSKLLKHLPQNLKEKFVLDAGGGSGYFSQLALERGDEEEARRVSLPTDSIGPGLRKHPGPSSFLSPSFNRPPTKPLMV